MTGAPILGASTRVDPAFVHQVVTQTFTLIFAPKYSPFAQPTCPETLTHCDKSQYKTLVVHMRFEGQWCLGSSQYLTLGQHLELPDAEVKTMP